MPKRPPVLQVLDQNRPVSLAPRPCLRYMQISYVLARRPCLFSVFFLQHSNGDHMQHSEIESIFTEQALAELFPESRTNEFFEALFGDAEEGSYTITLKFEKAGKNTLRFLYEL